MLCSNSRWGYGGAGAGRTSETGVTNRSERDPKGPRPSTRTDGNDRHMQPKFLGMFLGMQKQKTPQKGRICWVTGGSSGIRTLETFRFAGFQDRCNRPLCQASNPESLTCTGQVQTSRQLGLSMPRVSMNSITCARPVCVFRLVITKGLSPLAVVRMRTVSASITPRSAPT